MLTGTPCEQNAAPELAKVQVLIVDDELAVRRLLATLLTQAGIICSAAADPHEALILLNRIAFEAVISDLRMGPAYGFELLREVRTHFPNWAFLMATGVDDVRVGVQAMGEQFVGSARVIRSESTETPYPRYAFRFVEKSGQWVLQ